MLSVLALAGGRTHPLPAQGPPAYQRLTVRPRQLATGIRTTRAGEYHLAPPAIDWTGVEKSFVADSARVYVPQACVGTRRCPLLVFIWEDWNETLEYVRPMADRDGIILLSWGGPYYSLANLTNWVARDTNIALKERAYVDTTLRQVLQQFAIDPAKIAIMGTCATGAAPVNLGDANFAVFSRIISLSGAPRGLAHLDPPTPGVEFFFDAGVNESKLYFRRAMEWRQKGYRVTHAFGLRVHGHTLESYDHVGRWLLESWAVPDPAARPAPHVIADPLPELTPEVLRKMTAFWTRFVYEPDSIRMTARRAYLRDVVVPVGAARPVVVLTDMAALAAKYPAVAADLKAAGLTAREHDAYRVALASARALEYSGEPDVIGPLDPGSVQARNVAFMEAHPDEFQELEKVSHGDVREGFAPANMWNMP